MGKFNQSSENAVNVKKAESVKINIRKTLATIDPNDLIKIYSDFADILDQKCLEIYQNQSIQLMQNARPLKQ